MSYNAQTVDNLFIWCMTTTYSVSLVVLVRLLGCESEDSDMTRRLALLETPEVAHLG